MYRLDPGTKPRPLGPGAPRYIIRRKPSDASIYPVRQAGVATDSNPAQMERRHVSDWP